MEDPLSAPEPALLLGADGALGRVVTAVASRRGLLVRPVRELGSAPAGSVVIAAVPEPALAALVDRCIERGLNLVAPGADPEVLRGLFERTGEARAAGVTVAPAQGWDPVVADPLVARAAAEVSGPPEVHVAYALPGARLRSRSPGERARLRRLIGQPFATIVDGRRVQERDGEVRRLAWYPRPVGPRHAAGVPGPIVETVPRHLPGARGLRAYRAMSTAAAESRQLVANAARTGVGAALVGAVLERGSDRPDTADQRWACVVEVADERTVSRAWAHGSDHLDLTAVALLRSAARVSEASDVPTGVVAPSELAPAGALLDDLAAWTDLRWARARSERRGG